MNEKAGLYLELFHGRSDPEQAMDDWGEAGPILGPYRYAHTTYGEEINLGREDGDDDELVIAGGLVYYGGVWYGDWSAFVASPRSIREGGRHERFDEGKARPPRAGKD